MKTTIDKAGRVVIPAPIRSRAGFRPGTELEVEVDDVGVHLVRKSPGSTLVRVGRRWVARPGPEGAGEAPVDFAALVEEERNRWP
jgi:AbrB family looped-hinge helix DNA binding protein